jgi:hypothetical protein
MNLILGYFNAFFVVFVSCQPLIKTIIWFKIKPINMFKICSPLTGKSFRQKQNILNPLTLLWSKLTGGFPWFDEGKQLTNGFSVFFRFGKDI